MKNSNKYYLAACASVAFALLGCGRGEPGPMGPMGPQGVPGSAGSPGASSSNRVIATMNCSGTIEGLSGPRYVLNGYRLEYNAVLMTSGDVYATANVVTAQSQISGTAFYAAGQAGSANAEVVVVADLHDTPDAGYWRINVDRNSLITYASYMDPSLGPSPTNLQFLPSSCKVQNW